MAYNDTIYIFYFSQNTKIFFLNRIITAWPILIQFTFPKSSLTQNILPSLYLKHITMTWPILVQFMSLKSSQTKSNPTAITSPHIDCILDVTGAAQ